MKTKFDVEEKVLLGAEEHTVKGTSKNFSTNTMKYKLENGQMVNEGDLKRLSKLPKIKTELEELQERYELLYGKPVANSKKNDAEWIKSKNEEKAGKEDEEEGEAEEKTPFEVLSALNAGDLRAFIVSKGLDIDSDDYEGLEELKTAVAEELEIEIPE